MSKQLRFEPLTVADLPFQVLEEAFWRPQAAKLHGKHKESLAAISDAAAAKSYQKLRLAWRREETWIDYAFAALLAAIPDGILGSLMGEFTGGVRVTDPEIVKLDSAGIPEVTGDPDFVVMGERNCILGECKVAAHEKSHRYTFQQFTKYQTLGAMLSCARAARTQRDAAHLLLVPNSDPKTFCADHDQWSPRLEGRRLVVAPENIHVRDPKKRFHDFATWRTFIRKILSDKRILDRCELDSEAVDRLVSPETATLVPTYVITWAELMQAVRAEADRAGLRNLRRACLALEDLAYGRLAEVAADGRLDKFVAKKVTFPG